MRSISVIIIVVWLLLFGSLETGWISMQQHTFGVVTFVFGIIILIAEFLYWGNENRHWFGTRTP